jgi:tetratricopeptide (TPR) repeat protein
MATQPMAGSSSPISSFDPEVVWALHKRKIVWGAALAVLILLGGSVYFGIKAIQTQKAEKVYSAAQSIEGWQAVIRQFPNSTAAGNAYLRIAAKLTEDGKYSESDSNYESFLRQFPKHPLAVNGYMGLAANAEMEKNPEKALEYYRQVTIHFGNSFQAPIALFHEARITAAMGKLKEAQTLYENVVQRFPESTAAGIASREAGNLADQLSTQAQPKSVETQGSMRVEPAKSASPSPASTTSAAPTGSVSAAETGRSKPEP